MKKLILITGVAGFIGSKVASRFVEEGFQVVGVDDLSNGKLKNVPQSIDFIKGDFQILDEAGKPKKGTTVPFQSIATKLRCADAMVNID